MLLKLHNNHNNKLHWKDSRTETLDKYNAYRKI